MRQKSKGRKSSREATAASNMSRSSTLNAVRKPGSGSVAKSYDNALAESMIGDKVPIMLTRIRRRSQRVTLTIAGKL